ncbi:MAG TPA: hypothetical protein P5567_07295 [Kiritimatiellia bacterium]|nr:hypothetical protein [Kiritimatiellia bacterium]HRZ12245.1 hypothetical protein [Kiritimatiellia bacterium]HSA17997.1 hypothetical protein [Kiritimatiellia bacterium]
MTSLCSKTLCVWLVAGLLLAGVPLVGEAAISDSSSEGAVITVGLFVTIVAVLFIVGFKSDMDNVFGQRAGRANLALSAEDDASVLEHEEAAAGSGGLGFRLAF